MNRRIIRYKINQLKRHTSISLLEQYLKVMSLSETRKLGRILGSLLLVVILLYILIANFAPFGVTYHYDLGTGDSGISSLGPSNRVSESIDNGTKVYHQKYSLIYFTTKMPFNFDTATVKVTFQNPKPTQTLSLGFQDQEIWHYNTQNIDEPLLNGITWPKIGQNPSLYQQTPHYSSVNDFLNNPPKAAIIGTFDEDNADLGDPEETHIQGYTPQPQKTIISTPLRGPVVMDVYLENEPFEMTIEKQDLNWYKDPDTLTVTVYRGPKLVFQSITPDNGLINATGKALPPQLITINSKGQTQGNPENGVYKVVIAANSDTIIKQITTNLHKIVFEGSIFPVANRQTYPGVVSQSESTDVYTNALALSAVAVNKNGLQTIHVGSKSLKLNQVNQIEVTAPQQNLTEVTIPKSNVVLDGYFGYFAFSKDQFFLPTKYHILPITDQSDIDFSNYILTDYIPSKPEGSWRVSQSTFDLRTAYIINGELSWIIEAPNIQNTLQTDTIKDIQVTLSKKPWL